MSVQVFFSDFFGIDPDAVEAYGTVDISLVNDIPLFIDPFLLFNSDDPTYRDLHEEMIRYVTFLRNKAAAGNLDDGLLKEWFCFPEVRQLWLGFSLHGNDGSGLGIDFARKLSKNLNTIFSNFGDEEVTDGSHIEKLCLIEPGVGKDNISDFTGNLIKAFLVDYTVAFADQHLRDEHRNDFYVEKIRFNYDTESWVSEQYSLPAFDDDYVLLVPRSILRKDDTWINRTDLVRQFDDIRESMDNDQLRGRINNYFMKRLPPPEKVTAQDVRDAAVATIREFPVLIEYFIRLKEQNGEEATAISAEDVRFMVQRFVHNVRTFAQLLEAETEFFDILGNTKDEARRRVAFLKDVIEKKGGWRVFYVDNEPVLVEDHLHILFRLTWLGTPSDLSHEVDDGRGPADFKASRGAFDKTLVEFKLARNRKLKQNLEHQLGAYKEAADAEHGLKVILYFSEAELDRVRRILEELNMQDDENIILIDARSDNKPSASNIK